MEARRRLLALTLAAGMTLSGCGGTPAPAVTPQPTPTATAAPTAERPGFVLPCYPNSGFHPIEGTNRLNLTLAPLLYRGLFALDNSFQPQKELCESYTVSGDGRTWTFRLAEATFSDGSPVTAREVVQSLNLARRSQRYAGRLGDVSNVAAEGEAVVVTLSRPHGALPALLDIPIIKEGEDGQRPLGTGPYVLTEGEEGLQLTARAGAEVPLETIPLRTVEAGDDLVYAFDAQEISLVDTDLTAATVLGYSGRLETTDYPTTTFLYVGCNTAKGACREELVRQAVALTPDRSGLVRRLLSGHGVATALPIHPNAPEYDATLALAWSSDRERARALLDEAGWTVSEETGLRRKGRSELTLRLVVNQENTYKVAVAEALAAALEELSCAVTLERLPWDDFVAALEKGDFDLYLGETVLQADFELEPLVGRKGALNYGKFEDEEIEALLETCRAAAGEERVTTFVNLCGRMAEQSPIIPLCFKNGSVLTQWGQVGDLTPTQRDVFAGMAGWRLSF